MKPQSWMIVFLPVVKEMHAISCNVLQHVQGAVLFVCSLKKYGVLTHCGLETPYIDIDLDQH